MRLPDSFLQELKDRNNILDVVSGYVNLKRSGRTMSRIVPLSWGKDPVLPCERGAGLFSLLWLRSRRRRYYLYPGK